MTQRPTLSPPQDTRIPIDGFGQVLEMLRFAEAPFRESLLKRIERKDTKLAYLLRKSLYEESTIAPKTIPRRTAMQRQES